MAENEPTKVCPHCAETIKAAAKVCPFCRSKQGRYVLWRQELLIALPSAVLIITAITVIACFFPDEGGTGGRSFAGHRSDLVVLNTSLDRAGTKPNFWITGIVTNQGEYPWRHPDLKDSFVIQSHQETGFRVELGGLAFTNNNITHQVRVQMATDGDRPVKSD
jgi:hypothetical protein